MDGNSEFWCVCYTCSFSLLFLSLFSCLFSCHFEFILHFLSSFKSFILKDDCLWLCLYLISYIWTSHCKARFNIPSQPQALWMSYVNVTPLILVSSPRITNSHNRRHSKRSDVSHEISFCCFNNVFTLLDLNWLCLLSRF